MRFYLTASLAALAIMTVGFLYQSNMNRSMSDILVGTGCEGTKDGIAVAWEEDEMPRCGAIEVHRVGQPRLG